MMSCRFIQKGIAGFLIFALGIPSSTFLYAANPTGRLALDPSKMMAQANVAAPLNVDDLGFSKSDTEHDSNYQNLLNKRTKMLKIHQLLGLATGVAMALALSTSSGAAEGGKSSRDEHAMYGLATGALYFTTAGFSLLAPEVPGEKKSGRTKIHMYLAFIHFPAMVGTMIVGLRDKHRLDNGQSGSGLKSGLANTAAIAFYTSLAVMVIPFGGKGDHK